MMDGVPSPTQVQEQLARMLRRSTFTNAPKLASFLDYIVSCTLGGIVPEEWRIAVEVLGRREDWNAVEGDAAVRVRVLRLRVALAKYYEAEGSTDPVVITIAGYQALSEFNYRSPFVRSDSPDALGGRLGAAARDHFMMPGDASLRCVVSGEAESVGWHRLDSDPYNDSPANIIPLCARLRSHLDDVREGKIRTTPADLAPKHLAEELAPRYFREWRIANAYGCAALSFWMGEPPYGVENDEQRLLRLCDVIYYARHRLFEPIMAHLIAATVLPFLNRIDTVGAFAANRLALQLTALLEESDYPVEAEAPFAFAERLSGKYARQACPPGSVDAFTLLRRRAQLLSERAPHDERFDSLLRPAEEVVENDANRALILTCVKAHRWFRQASPSASKLAYESLAPVASHYSALLGSGGLFKPPGIDVANLTEILLSTGISACRVQASGWHREAEEMLVKGKRLLYQSRYVLATGYANFLLPGTYPYDPKASRLLQLSPAQIKPALRDAARIDIGSVLKCLARLRVLGKTTSRLP